MYYSNDYGVTYNYINRTEGSNVPINTLVNEDGTIALVSSLSNSFQNKPFWVGYIDKNNLTNTTWHAITGVGNYGFMFGNDYFTKVFLCTRSGTWIFDNNDTSKLSDSSYWNRSTNSNLSNISSRMPSASQDLRVIVIPNYITSSQEIWISTDYGNNFSNMYNSELTAFSTHNAYASVSPDGQIVMLFGGIKDLYFYNVKANGTYYLLSIVPNSLFNESVHYAVQSNNRKVLLLDNSYQTNNTNGAAIILNFENNLTFDHNIFKFKGPNYASSDLSQTKVQNIRIETTDYVPLLIDEMQLWVDNSNIIPSQAVITQSSTYSNDTSENIADSNLVTYARTNRGLGEYVDISFNTPIVNSDIQSLVLYSNNTNYNPEINKIRFVTTFDTKVELSKVDVYIDHSNNLSDTLYQSNQGVGEFIDISLNNPNFNNINNIVVHAANRDFSSTKLQFYDLSNVLYAELQNTYNGYNHRGITTPTYDWDFRIVSSGTVSDRVSSSNATYNGGMSSTVANGAFLDGVNDYITLPTFPLGGDAFTIEMYFKTNAFINNGRIFEFSDNSYYNNSIIFFITSSNIIHFKVVDGPNNDISNNRVLINNIPNYSTFGTTVLNVWKHYVIVYSKNNIKMYLDGNLSINYNLEGYRSDIQRRARSHHTIGANIFNNNATEENSMNIKLFRIWDGTALTSNQVSTLYNIRETVNIDSLSLNTTDDTSIIYSIHNFNNSFSESRKLNRISIESMEPVSISLEEVQLWVNQSNVLACKPTNTFILTGNDRSLTDKYSTTALTLNGSPTFDTNGVNLTGSQYITIPQSILGFENNDFTISVWIQANDSFNSNFQTLISLGYNNNNSALLSTTNDSSQRVYFQDFYNNNSNNTILQSEFNYTNDGIAHNYLITRKNSIIRVFIDGIQKLSLTRSIPYPTADYHIGYMIPRNNGTYLHGTVKRLDIWKGTGFDF
tara:strand:- start:592 stop:3447 length:2856 start_codon:yes stop_codon:yes gene_type:complete